MVGGVGGVCGGCRALDVHNVGYQSVVKSHSRLVRHIAVVRISWAFSSFLRLLGL